MKKPTEKPVDEMELRRWCIEQSLRWPSGGFANQVGQVMINQEDPISRAERILKWVRQ